MQFETTNNVAEYELLWHEESQSNMIKQKEIVRTDSQVIANQFDRSYQAYAFNLSIREDGGSVDTHIDDGWEHRQGYHELDTRVADDLCPF